MPGLEHKPFPHRHNKDGSYDSICPICFLTVARCLSEADLADLEQQHRCDQESLINLTQSRAILLAHRWR